MPFWLAPTQVVLAAITDDANEYSVNFNNTLVSEGIRSELDIRNEQISYKVREHSLQKIPYIVAIGKKEINDNTVSVRTLGSDKNIIMATDEFLEKLLLESKNPIQN